MSTDAVVAYVRDGVGHLVLNRPKAINALTHAMVSAIADALAQWRSDDAVRLVVLRGAGERGLCAGGDIVAIYHDAQTESTGSLDFWRDEYTLNAAIATFPKPYVAIMDGIVMGGGVGLSAHGSVRLVTERSMVAMPETGIGFIPDVGGTYLLSRAPGELGTHAALTALRMSGADAIACGLADHYLPSDLIDDFVSALSTQSVDDAVREFSRQPTESELLAQRGWIDAAYAVDDPREIVQRLEACALPGARDARQQLLAKSPTAVAATLRSLRRAAELRTLEEVLNQEYRVSSAALRSHDLREGFRAQVIDKD
ncbi:MAG: enoyl-CoA hydratase/isomerase family protein, partial [Rhodococcus sp.]|nr:enoyl-CoA hydratase/isomerase family protein [Rhodococcus sp. (in: high G+C Gram-positive bacteria)]